MNEQQKRAQQAEEFYGLRSLHSASEIENALATKFRATPLNGTTITFGATTDQHRAEMGDDIGPVVGTFAVRTPWGEFGMRTFFDDSGGNGTSAARDELRARFMMLPARGVMLRVAMAAYDAGYALP
jgi:hypothetical protein